MRNRFLIAFALLAAVSCQSDDTQDSALGDGFLDGGEMTFSTSVSETRAGMTTEDLTDFGIYVEHNGAFTNENVKASYDNSSWSTATDMTYPSWNEEVFITAYSPYTDSENTPTSFSVQSDQSTEAGVKASDLLLASSAVTPSATPNTDNDIYYTHSTGITTVKFNHTMAKFTLNLTLGTEWATASENPVSSVTISGTKTNATVDFTDGSITATGSSADITALCLSYAGGNASLLSYEAILVPQEVENLTVTVTTSDGMTIPYIIGTTTLSGNENHTFALSIGTMPPVDYITFQRNLSDTKNMIHTQDEGAITSILSKFRRCLMTSDGNGNATICYLQNDNSNYYAADGSDADLTGAEGDVMVYFPEYWYKYENVDDNYFRYYFSESEKDGYVHVGASLVGAYKGYSTDSKMYSISDQTPNSLSGNMTYATNRGTGYQAIDYHQHCVIAMMLYAKYLDRDIQTYLGTGASSYGITTGSNNTNGNNDTNNATSGYVNGLAIEGVYGSMTEYMSGITYNEKTSVYTITELDGTTREIESVYLSLSNYTLSRCITNIAAEDGDYFDLIPTGLTENTSYDTYYSDCMTWQVTSYTNRSVMRSGNDAYAQNGVAYIKAYTGTGWTWDCSRLAFRGTITEAASVEAYKALFN